MFKSLSKGDVKVALKDIEWDTVIKQGAQLKKKMGSKKWEARYACVTKGHIVWFEDEDAFKRQKVKGVLSLYDVDRVFVADCPPDDKPDKAQFALKPRIMHVVMKNDVVYLFSEDWKKEMDICLRALPPMAAAVERRSSIREPLGLRVSRSLPNLKSDESKKKQEMATEVNFNQCMKSGYVEKRKFEDGHKWEHRYLVLTTGHLAWFTDKAARDKLKPILNVIDLRDIIECTLQPVPGDKTVGEAVFVVLADTTYLFYDSALTRHLQEYWRDNINFARSQLKPRE